MVRAPVVSPCLPEGMVVAWTKGSFGGLELVRRHAFDGEDFGGGLVLGRMLLSGLGGFLVAQFRPCCRTSAKGAAATMTEVVGMLVLEDLDTATKEVVLLLLLEDNGFDVSDSTLNDQKNDQEIDLVHCYRLN